MASGVSTQSSVCPSISSPASEEGGGCSICLESLGVKDKALACGHIFDEGCIDLWLKTREICPLCRAAGIISPVGSEGADMSQESQNQGAHIGSGSSEPFVPRRGGGGGVLHGMMADIS